MRDWKETTLGEVAEFVSAKITTNKITVNNYVSTENLLADRLGVTVASTIPNISKVNYFKKGDVLFSNIRTYFKKVWYANKEGGSSNDVIIFRSKKVDVLNNKFLYYFISSDFFIDYTVKSAKGTKMPRGDKNAIKLFKINLPPLPEQQAIANVLTAFDDKIELLQQQNQTLETLAQTIFQEWFGKYSVDDELPDGWRVGKLSEIASLKSGYAFKSDDFVEFNSKKVLKIKDLKGNGKVDLNDISSICDEITNIKRVQYFKLFAGDIVLAMSGNTTGKIGIVPPHMNDVYLNQRVGKFFLIDEKMKSFLYNFLMSGDYESKILSMGYGSAQPNISPTQIENINIIIPNNDKLDKFIKISNPIFIKVLENNSQIQSLTKTRDTLLPKLMSGQVRV